MKKKILISPSLLSADFNCLGTEIEKAVSAGADYLHFDVMDGHFVPNISFGIPVLKSIRGTHPLVNDVHLMISDPLFYAPKFIAAGADIVTFHLEACKNEAEVRKVLKIIHDNGAKAGLSIKPGTPASALLPYLEETDLVLVMSVEPGFGGQSFLTSSLDKIREFRKAIDEKNLKVLIEVDGGVNGETGRLAREAGVDVLVAGSYLFGRPDMKERIRGLRE